MFRHHAASLRSGSSGSGTPLEDDDDIPRRSTRGRNPLPPTSGPLFPPLPPKQPRNSPKDSPKARASISRTPLAPSSSTIPSTSELEDEAEADDLFPTEAPGSRASSEKPAPPSGSGTSLTPPPMSEEAGMDLDPTGEEQEEGEGEGEGGGEGPDEWNAYRRRHGVRGFSAVKADVKIEPEDDLVDDDVTPRKTRNGVTRAAALAGESSHNTPSASTSASASERAERAERAESQARQSRKRRGEELLLLDDHLLPEEMRKTGTLTGKRDRPGHVRAPEQEQAPTKGADEAEPEDGEQEGGDEELEDGEGPVEGEAEKLAKEEEMEEVEEVGEAEEVEDEPMDEDGDDDDGGEITRCVCQKEDGDAMMIQCDKCNVWQHGPCVGIWADEEAPDEYFCEQCRPELHGPLKRWIRSRGRNIAAFVPPLPEDLKALHNPYDKYPPSQSKRWTDPALMEPPPTKPSSRPQPRREPLSPVDNADGRRLSRGKLPPPSTGRSGSAKAESVEPKQRRGTAPIGHRRKASVGTVSPPPPGESPPVSGRMEPRKRSTMNSRDAMYEEEVKAALEASRMEMTVRESEEADADRPVEEEVLPETRINKGKRKRDDDDVDSVEPVQTVPPPPPKAKHPNQYTYRPKPVSSGQPAAPSPARRGQQGGTPVPVAQPAQHEHGTRRAGALANGAMNQPFTTTVSVSNLHWHLPDHLSACSDLFSTAAPTPLEVRSPRNLPHLPRNHFHNQRYGPFTEERDEDGKLRLPSEPPTTREPVGEKGTHLEPPARVKFPTKRITTGEMRKRVRNVLEYVGRVQGEEAKRKERAATLGIVVEPVPAKAKEQVDGASEGDNGKGEDGGGHTIDGEGDVEMADAKDESSSRGEGVTAAVPANGEAAEPELGPPEQAQEHKVVVEEEEVVVVVVEEEEEEEEQTSKAVDTATGPTSAQLLDDLTRDLIAFQETWAAGGFLSPVPPPSATFPTANGDFPSSGLAKSIVPEPSEAEGSVVEGEVGEDELAGEVAERETAHEEGMADGVDRIVQGSTEGGAASNEAGGDQNPEDQEVDTRQDGTPTEEAQGEELRETRQDGTPTEEAQGEELRELQGDEQEEEVVVDKADLVPELQDVPEAEGADAPTLEEVADEPVDVYREGQVGVIVAEPAEEAMAAVIEAEVGLDGSGKQNPLAPLVEITAKNGEGEGDAEAQLVEVSVERE